MPNGGSAIRKTYGIVVVVRWRRKPRYSAGIGLRNRSMG